MKAVMITILVLVMLVAGATMAFAADNNANIVENGVCSGDGVGCSNGETCEYGLEDGTCLDTGLASRCGGSGGGCRR